MGNRISDTRAIHAVPIEAKGERRDLHDNA